MSAAGNGGVSPRPLTFFEAREAVRALGMAMRRTGYDREVRVWNRLTTPDRAEATAYYTDDLEDAVGTARAMAANMPALSADLDATRVAAARAAEATDLAAANTKGAARWRAVAELGERVLAWRRQEATS